MSTPTSIKGILPILPSPFNESGEIVLSDIDSLVDFACETGAVGIGYPAYGSEFYKLSTEERESLTRHLLQKSKGRIVTMIQCNHVSPYEVARLAQNAEKNGADLICTLIPRQFPSSDRQKIEFAKQVCDSTSLPVMIQDWNPGSKSVGLDFITEVHRSCKNFRYIKYEEPQITPLIEKIRQETSGSVEVFSGWGGVYLMELFPAGISGIIPGFSCLDYWIKIWNHLQSGEFDKAFDMFSDLSPFLQFSLQNLEIFHHAEKRLLLSRGLISSSKVRSLTIELDRGSEIYLNRLLDRMPALFEKNKLTYQRRLK